MIMFHVYLQGCIGTSWNQCECCAFQVPNLPRQTFEASRRKFGYINQNLGNLTVGDYPKWTSCSEFVYLYLDVYTIRIWGTYNPNVQFGVYPNLIIPVDTSLNDLRLFEMTICEPFTVIPILLVGFPSHQELSHVYQGIPSKNFPWLSTNIPSIWMKFNDIIPPNLHCFLYYQYQGTLDRFWDHQPSQCFAFPFSPCIFCVRFAKESPSFNGNILEFNLPRRIGFGCHL